MPYRDSTDGPSWSYSCSAPVIAAAPSARSRDARARHGRVARSAGAMSADRGDDPVVPQDGNGDGHGAGEELALAPSRTPSAERRSSRSRRSAAALAGLGQRPRPGSRPGRTPAGPWRARRRRAASRCPARRSPAARARTAPRAGRPPTGRPAGRSRRSRRPPSTSIRRTGSACRISSSLLTVAPPVRCSRGPSR